MWPRRKHSVPKEWFSCPTCGESVPVGALACSECGSDRETGWSEAAEYDDLDLPESLVPDTLEEFLGEASKPRFTKPALWTVVLLVLAFLIVVLR